MTSSTEDGGGSNGPRLDLGDKPDLEPPQPAGCKGKIDFLFVISSGGFVEGMQEQLIDAFPKFIETIQAKFADFDYHILVTDGRADYWGSPYCTKACPMHPDPACVGYPCDLLDLAGPCETTWGAGNVFNVGQYTMNKPCDVAGGKRYVTREQPQLAETFECIARVGAAGADLLGYTLVKAISPEFEGPGGCNEGFLRDDALLVVTLLSDTYDAFSQGTVESWIAALREAKHGDEDAFAVLVLTTDIDVGYWQLCHPDEYSMVKNRLRLLVEGIEHGFIGSICEETYTPFFAATVAEVVELCDGLVIPQ